MFDARSLFTVTAASAALLAVLPAPARSSSLGVQIACANDYFAYCARHDPDSSAARACMRANGTRLSQRCVNALVAAGEVSRTEVTRRASVRK